MSFFHKKKKGENKFPPSFLCYTAKGKRDKKSEQRPKGKEIKKANRDLFPSLII